MHISVSLTPEQAAEIRRMMNRTTSRVEAQRCRIILLLAEGRRVREVREMVGCVRCTVYTTLYRFEETGMDGLIDRRLHPAARKATPEVRSQLLAYLDHTPQHYGWQRPTWTRELLALQLRADAGVELSHSYVSRILRQEKCRRGRPRPALRIPVRGRRAVLDRIEALVEQASCTEEVFYVDEADIDLNPRIGLTYIKRGQQPLVLTPGKNIKYYIAGALNSRTGNIVYTHGLRKDSELFVGLLDRLAATYRRARRIHLVLDNYIIHKSQRTSRVLDSFQGRIQLHFLPPYSPDDNPIERLWKQMHDNVTRNHQHTSLESLWKAVTQFLHNAQPFPGTKASTMRLVA
jgi:transposase